MYNYLKKFGRFEVSECLFYAAEIILALKFLHSKKIIYRDVKPENILINQDGHIKLIDLGLAKELFDETTSSFCGTSEYVAPEIILGKNYDYSVDLWSLGILIYEMLSGKTPFFSPNKKILFQKILENEPEFKHKSFSPQGIHLITRLLDKNPKTRITIQEVMKHQFFSSIDFDKVLAKEAIPPFIPVQVMLNRKV